ncbi:MAG: hypothetical protein L0241_24125 [Planctomycetia bacterium]|nr:hypothetical protein [Planctomycetia bacterium]
MKKDNALKKHHFWILLGLVPLLALIAVLIINSSVGGKIADKDGEIEKAQKAIPTGTPKSEGDINRVTKFGDDVASKQGGLWKANWDRQKDFFTWPEHQILKPLEDAYLGKRKDLSLKFGDPIPLDPGDLAVFKNTDTYLAQFSNVAPGIAGKGTGMADKIAPTQFRGGWQSVLRHVSANGWGEKNLTKDQVWLALEDIWVQRSLLSAVQSVNESLAKFERVRYVKDGVVIDDPKGPQNDPKRRLFRGRTWEVALEVVKDGNDDRLTGTLTNISNRLQLMGIGNVMTLNVWIDRKSQPIPFKISGEFLPGKGAMKPVKDKDGKETGEMVPANVLTIDPLDDHKITGLVEEIEITRVEQVFDARTVPIKRIDALALSYPDSRNANAQFHAHRLLPEAQPTQGTQTDPMGLGGTPETPTPMGMGFPGGPPTGPGAGTTTTGRKSGGGSITEILDANKKRYIAITDQVRRMPVGIVLIVDQAYIQDVLLAFTNSPLRFQITQTAWTRFRYTLDNTGFGSSGSEPGVIYSEGGSFQGGIGANIGEPDPEREPIRPESPPSKLPSVSVPPVGGGSSGPGYPGNPYSPYGSGVPTIASESQLTSGLVELSIYGIVSLYEKFEVPTPTDKQSDGKGDEKVDPKGDGKGDGKVDGKVDPKQNPKPAPKPDPKTPMPMNSTPPKMRRRK